MSIGNTADMFRIYRTENGGQTWTLTFQNTEPTAFYDCMAFFDKHRGLGALGSDQRTVPDPGDERRGRSWQIIDADMPPALPGEFAFAASGQCLTAVGGQDAWFGTGGDAVARVFHSSDRGRSWTVANTPIRSLTSGGSPRLPSGIRVTGSQSEATLPQAPPRWTRLRYERRRSDVAAEPGYAGRLRSGAHWVTGSDVIIVGEGGSDVSTDQGRTWRQFDEGASTSSTAPAGSPAGRGRAGPRRFRRSTSASVHDSRARRCRTLEPSLPTASALAIAGDRIAGGVATHEVALPSPDRVDLGALRPPGLLGRPCPLPDVGGRSAGDLAGGRGLAEEALARVRDGLGSVPEGGWLRGRAGVMRRPAPPTKEALDEVAGEVPIALLAHDSHSLWINSAALSRADGDLDVDGGVVERDASGEATGVLREEALAVPRSAHPHRGRGVPPRDARGPAGGGQSATSSTTRTAGSSPAVLAGARR